MGSTESRVELLETRYTNKMNTLDELGIELWLISGGLEFNQELKGFLMVHLSGENNDCFTSNIPVNLTLTLEF